MISNQSEQIILSQITLRLHSISKQIDLRIEDLRSFSHRLLKLIILDNVESAIPLIFDCFKTLSMALIGYISLISGLWVIMLCLSNVEALNSIGTSCLKYLQSISNHCIERLTQSTLILIKMAHHLIIEGCFILIKSISQILQGIFYAVSALMIYLVIGRIRMIDLMIRSPSALPSDSIKTTEIDRSLDLSWSQDWAKACLKIIQVDCINWLQIPFKTFIQLSQTITAHSPTHESKGDLGAQTENKFVKTLNPKIVVALNQIPPIKGETEQDQPSIELSCR